MSCLDYLENFTLNKMPGNIALSQEFSEISPLRQKVILTL